MKNINMPLVHIIVLHWNNYIDTYECIKSIQRITYGNFKTILVDNGSTDNSVRELQNKFHFDKIITTEKNLGFSGGNNMGIKYALKNKADYVLLLNNDTIVDEPFLTELVDTFTVNKKIGIVSPKIYYANKHNIIWATGAVKNKKSKYGYIDPGFQIKDQGQFNKILEVDCVWGCCMLISSNVFSNIGLFDDDFFLYAEDMDFCYRVKKLNYKIIFNPKSIIWHKVSTSSGGEGSYVKEYYNIRNLILFAKKNLKGKELLSYYLFFLLDNLYAFFKLMYSLKFKTIFTRINGLYDGFNGIAGYKKFSAKVNLRKKII